MTNNPTIDGVSREEFEREVQRKAERFQPDFRRCGDNPEAEYKDSTLQWAYELCQAMRSSAPAVERQESAASKFRGGSVGVPRDLLEAMCSYEWHGELASSNAQQLRGILDGRITGWESPEVTAPQSTIVRLEARIAELESGPGEPVAFIQIPKNVEKYGHADQADRLCFGKPGQFFVDGKSPMFDFIPLYTAPPARVTVVPEKYDDVLLPFLALMRAELHANAHKGDRPGWLQMDSKTAILEVFYHLGKLHQAVHRGEEAAIKEYAADVANMCMMLLDVCACLDATAALNRRDTLTFELADADGYA